MSFQQGLSGLNAARLASTPSSAAGWNPGGRAPR